jgi:hypothetical protein
MQPVEHKLKFKVKILLKRATTGKFETTDDPLQFKANNPNNLLSKVGETVPTLDDSGFS